LKSGFQTSVSPGNSAMCGWVAREMILHYY
jgi:hypothetical protein